MGGGWGVCSKLLTPVCWWAFDLQIRTTIFSGAVTHSQLMASYKSRKSGRRYRSSRSKRERKMEFLNMRGPRGIGHAEMAVSQVETESPTSGVSCFSGPRLAASLLLLPV